MMNRRGIATAFGSMIVLGTVIAGPQTASATTTPEKYDTHSAAAAVLKSAGITWSSSGDCSDRDNPECTSFEKINKATVSGIIGFKKISNCAVNITGGTETGHSSGTYSHWNGYKVDITVTTCVSDWITKNLTYIGKRDSDSAPMYKSASGNIYARETNPSHWDILYYA